MRTFIHAETGVSVAILEGSRTETLVEADPQWSETAPAKKAAAKPSAKK